MIGSRMTDIEGTSMNFEDVLLVSVYNSNFDAFAS